MSNDSEDQSLYPEYRVEEKHRIPHTGKPGNLREIFAMKSGKSQGILIQ